MNKLHSEKWWQAWREQDYSWDGLAQKEWAGWSVDGGKIVPTEGASKDATPATLQDYWRDEEPFLVERDGKKWARPHVPERWADGSPAKMAWSENERAALRALIARRLDQAKPTSFTAFFEWAPEPVGGDHRARLDGCVLFESVKGSQKAVRASFKYGAFLGSVDFTDAVFEDFCDFERAAFFGTLTRFNSTDFNCETVFLGALFEGVSYFRAAKFRKGARFSASVSDFMSFEHATFFGDAYFYNTTFSILSFSEAIFDGAVEFAGREPKHSTSEQVSRIRLAHVDGGFSGELLSAAKEADHAGRTFGLADFSRCAFRGDANFINRRFLGRTDFSDTVWGGVAAFEGAEFAGETTFHGAKFLRVPVAARNIQLTFWFLFSLCAVLLLLANWHSAQKGVYLAVAALVGAAIPVAALLRRYAKNDQHVLGSMLPRGEQFERHMRAFRTLTLLSERTRNRVDSAVFYRLELLSRRLMSKGVSPVEKFFSVLYDISSAYGESLWRPIGALLLSVVIFAWVFMHWDAALWRSQPLERDSTGALTLSARNVFSPLSVWAVRPTNPSACVLDLRLLSPTEVQCEERQLLVSVAERERQGLAVKLVSTLQSWISIVLLFLFGLAVRRRFQMG